MEIREAQMFGRRLDEAGKTLQRCAEMVVAFPSRYDNENREMAHLVADVEEAAEGAASEILPRPDKNKEYDVLMALSRYQNDHTDFSTYTVENSDQVILFDNVNERCYLVPIELLED